MKHRTRLLSFLSFLSLLLSACATASGTLAPLGPDHPANAQAEETPIQDPAAFLREADSAPGAAATPVEPAGAIQGKYVCPMHPEVTSEEQGRCPKCGMALVPRQEAEVPGEEHPHER
jgi:heavy metal-binding protein